MSSHRKLTDQQVCKMREEFRNHKSVDKSASDYSVSKTVAYYAIRGLFGYSVVSGGLTSDEIGLPASKKSQRGENHSRSLLSDASVLLIRKELIAGERYEVLASKYGVTKAVIASIAQDKTWTHLGSPLNLNKKRRCGTRNLIPGGNRKLNDTTISYIKWHLKVGVAISLLAKYFKVHRHTIYKIAHELQWAHVKAAKSAPALRPGPARGIRIRGERLQEKIKEVSVSRA